MTEAAREVAPPGSASESSISQIIPKARRLPSAGAPFAEVFAERCGVLDLSDLDPTAFPEPVVHLAREVWQDRVRTEYRSIQIMSRFLGELANAGEAPEILASAIDLVEDEVRHAAYCAALLGRLGGTALLPDPVELRENDTFVAAPAVERALHTAVTMLAINETISVAYVEDLRARCTTPAVLRVLEATVADEAGHQELGWSYVKLALARFSRSTLPSWRHLVDLSLKPHRDSIGRVLEKLPPRDRHPDRHADRELVALGLYSDARQALVGHAAIERRVLPRLRELELA